MAKKKNQAKKHKFKHAPSYGTDAAATNSALTQTPVSRPLNNSLNSAVRRATPQNVATSRDFSYVPKDLRRVMAFALCLVALEIILWFVFGHTAFGPKVYQSVNV
jgi:hypothetical protein